MRWKLSRGNRDVSNSGMVLLRHPDTCSAVEPVEAGPDAYLMEYSHSTDIQQSFDHGSEISTF